MNNIEKCLTVFLELEVVKKTAVWLLPSGWPAVISQKFFTCYGRQLISGFLRSLNSTGKNKYIKKITLFLMRSKFVIGDFIRLILLTHPL